MRGIGSDSAQIARSIVTIGFFLLLAKSSGAIKEIIIAWKFGVSELVDAYVFSFGLVTLPNAIWYSVLTVVAVPILVLNKAASQSSVTVFKSQLLGLTLVFGLCSFGAIYSFVPSLMEAQILENPVNLLRLTGEFTRSIAIISFFGILSSYLSVVLMADNRHSNSLLEAIPAVTLAIVTLFGPNISLTLVIGTCLGFCFNSILLFVSAKRHNLLLNPTFAFSASQWAIFRAGFGIILAGQILMSLTSVIDQFISSGFGAGKVAELGYGTRLLSLVLSMGALSVSRAVLPVLSRVSTQSNMKARSLAYRWAIIVFFIGSIIGTGLWYFSPLIVSLMFERGAFQTENTIAVARVVSTLAIQVPFYFSGLVLVAFLAAAKRYKTIAAGGSLNFLIKAIALYYLIVFFDFGMDGVLYSTVIMHIASFLFLLFSTKMMK